MIEASRQNREQQRKLQILTDRITQNIHPTPKSKSSNDSNLILTSLKNHFIFYNLSQEQLQNVKDHMFYCTLDEGTMLFEKDSIGSCFFIIERGTMEILVDDVVRKELKSMEGFGELALLYHHQRTSSVKAQTHCSLWAIDKITFREAVEEIVTKEYQTNRKYLETLKFYSFLTNDTKDKIASSLVKLKYYKNQMVVEQGDPGSAFFIIKQGVASLIKNGIEQRKMYRGESFGEMSLYYNTMRKMSVKADEPLECLVLGRETLANILGDNFHQLMFGNFMKYAFSKNKNLVAIPRHLQDKVFENMKIVYYKANDIIFRKGSPIYKLIVIFQGRLKKFRSPNILASSGEVWGEDYLEKNKEVRIDDNIVAESDVVATEISFEQINKLLGESYKQTMSNQLLESMQLYKKYKIENKSVIQSCELSQFVYLRQLSKIHYGSMHLVENNKLLFCAKIINKTTIKQQSLEPFVNNELKVLKMIEHPFLASYFTTFELDNYYVNIFEYVQGIELYDVIRQIGLLSTKDCQFYIASMILLLDYLQHKEIVLRDLKPENFMVDEEGYLKFISFESSKWIGESHKTTTIIGTPHYMAPEVIEGKQYNELVDLWAVGVMLYEFINGTLPFGAQTDNPYEIYQSILKGELKYPSTLKDKRAKRLIEELLSNNPEARYDGSYSNLKSNSWFSNISWADLYDKNSKKVKPVYIPEKMKVNREEIAKLYENSKGSLEEELRKF